MKAVIVSSVHRAGDARILHKEAATLARAGYEVVLIAQGEGAPLPVAGVRLVDLPRTTQRWRRPANWWRLWRWALRERAGIYHFHDPELLPWGLLLQRVARRPVIYDAHED